MPWLIEGLVAAAVVGTGAWFLVVARRAQRLSLRRLDVCLTIGLIVLGLWFMWLSWLHLWPVRPPA